MVTGTAMHHVGGGDRTNLPTVTVYGPPKPKRSSIDWDAIAAAQPQTRLCDTCRNVELPTTVTTCDTCIAAQTAADEHADAITAAADLLRRLPRLVKASTRHPDAFEAAGQVIQWAEILNDLLPGNAVPTTTPKPRGRRTTSTTSTRSLTGGARRTPLPEQPEFIAACRAAYEDEHLNIAETADKLGSSYLTVRTALKNAGVTLRQSRGRTARKNVDAAALISRYQGGETIPTLARDFGCSTSTIRRVLEQGNVTLRDDRARGGGQNRAVDAPELVAEIRALYLDERLSQDQVALRLNLTRKVVTRIMRDHDIPARQGQSGGGDTLVASRDRLEQLGTTNAAIRTWARAQGIEVGDRGVVPSYIVDAYATAHGAA